MARSQMHAVNGAGQQQVRRANFLARPAGLIFRIVGFIQRSLRKRLLAQLHQDHVHGQPMQPGGKRGFSAKRPDLAKQLQKGVLREVLRLGRDFRPCADTKRRPAGYEADRCRSNAPASPCWARRIASASVISLDIDLSRAGHRTRRDASAVWDAPLAP